MPTDYANQFENACQHDPKCPSWWGCGTRRSSSYWEAKSAYADYMIARAARACGYPHSDQAHNFSTWGEDINYYNVRAWRHAQEKK